MTYMKWRYSERLEYRPLEHSDAQHWIEFLSNKTSTQFFPELDITPEQRAELWISSQLDRYQQGTYGMYALIHKEDRTFIGQCGLLIHDVKGKEETEVGYHLIEEYTGRGYATEAAQHMKAYGFEVLQKDSIISIIHKDNLLSQKVALRNGMKADFETEWKGLPVIIFRATNPHDNY